MMYHFGGDYLVTTMGKINLKLKLSMVQFALQKVWLIDIDAALSDPVPKSV